MNCLLVSYDIIMAQVSKIYFSVDYFNFGSVKTTHRVAKPSGSFSKSHYLEWNP